MSNDERCERALRSLEGLGVGDALGQRFFGANEDVLVRIRARELPPSPWHYTDDTEMALSIVATLLQRGHIEQDALAQAFSDRMHPERGYGRGASEILYSIRRGGDWRVLSAAVFGGRGSYGNGAAMRVAPLGAYFADDLERCAREAQLQAEVTHVHSEAIAGGVATAVAAALVWQHREAPLPPNDFLRDVSACLPRSVVRDKIESAMALAPHCTVGEAAGVLGNGSSISAQDTVPLCLWVVSRHLQSTYEEAFWEIVAALGDRDTTGAIVGGILGAVHAPPASWLSMTEELVP